MRTSCKKPTTTELGILSLMFIASYMILVSSPARVPPHSSPLLLRRTTTLAAARNPLEHASHHRPTTIIQRVANRGKLSACGHSFGDLLSLRGGAGTQGDDMDVEEIVSPAADPHAAEAEKQKGNDAYTKREFQTAVEHYSKAIELDPKSSVYLNNRAAAFMAMEKLDDAEADVNKAIQMENAKPMDEQDDKALGRSYSRLGTLHFKRGNYTGAIWWFKNSVVEYSFPETALKLREAEKALKEQKAREYVDPEKSAEAKSKGNELFRKGEYAEALKMYAEAIKRNPDDPKVWNNRAACYQKLYELRLGIKDSEKAVELDPNYVKGWSRLGQMYYGVKDLVKAKRAFQRMQEIEPGNTDAQKGLDMVATMEQTTPADPNEVQRRVQNDPEAMSIMQDPQMQKVLQELQSNPSSAQKWMADPIVSRKLQKLIDVGVIRTSPAPP